MTEPTGRVVVVGGSNLDVVATVGRHPEPGETVLGSRLAHFTGGKGANQAIAAARAGAPTLLVGAVGRDAAGDRLRDDLDASGVVTRHVAVLSDAPTGTALIAVADGENTIIVVPGANASIAVEAIGAVALGPADVLVGQLEIPDRVTTAAFEQARRAGATTVLNPAPADRVPADLVALADVLVVNEHELQRIFDVGIDRLLDPSVDPADRLRAAFAGTLVATLGPRGAVAVSSSGVVRVAGHPVAAVDTTGAGDCFVGYLAAGLRSGEPLERSLALANAAAARSVTRPGAASSIPWRSELVDEAGGRPAGQPPEPEPGSTR